MRVGKRMKERNDAFGDIVSLEFQQACCLYSYSVGFDLSHQHRFNPCLSSLLFALCIHSCYNCDHVSFLAVFFYLKKIMNVNVLFTSKICVNVALLFVAKDIRQMQRDYQRFHRFASRP